MSKILFKKGNKVGSETRFKKGHGRIMDLERYKEIGLKISKTKKGKLHLNQRGENHYNWKGGVTKEDEKIRKSIEYKLWREAVFKRDNYTCIWCCEHGGRLNADHIKPFALFPELRFAIDNGRTLCVKCHKSIDTWYIRRNKNVD